MDGVGAGCVCGWLGWEDVMHRVSYELGGFLMVVVFYNKGAIAGETDAPKEGYRWVWRWGGG